MYEIIEITNHYYNKMKTISRLKIMHVYTLSKCNELPSIHSGGSSKNPLAWQHASSSSTESADTQQLKRSTLYFQMFWLAHFMILIPKKHFLIHRITNKCDIKYICNVLNFRAFYA